ncbi:MAG: sodium:solute symporter family protein [Flavisolibacter sp.]
MNLHLIDYSIIALYFLFVVGIGVMLKRRIKTGNDFLMSNRSIPLWITSLAFISANLGAQEVLGMAASGAKYGLYTAHYYWLGAVIAMVFLGVFMMPFYYGSRARSVPEYLKLRFDEKTRTFNALTFAVMTVFSSGISLYALAMLMDTILGWDFNVSIWLAAGIVLVYILLGGLTSAVYNEVLQFFLIVLGIAPLVYIGMHQAGGWQGIMHNVDNAKLHLWKGMGSASTNPMGVDAFSLVFGLGFVLAFGYWCTDFLVVQRAMISRNLNAAQRTPIIAALPKIFMPLIVIMPGIILLALQSGVGGYDLPKTPSGDVNYNMTLPLLLQKLYPSGILGVGITALIASFMSGMAGNVTAFNTVWTFDIYQSHINRNASERHYLYVGKATTVVGILISIATAYVARGFNSIMDLLQLVFSFVNAPLFATFFLGMFWKKTTPNGAFWGLLSGTAAAAITHGLTVAEGKGGWLAKTGWSFPSGTSQAFNIAGIAFIVCFLVTVVISLFTERKPEAELKGLVYSLTPRQKDDGRAWYRNPLTLGVIVLLITLVFNIIFF